MRGFDGKRAVEVLLNYLEKSRLESIHAETRLMIAPGYQFRFASGLISNFHQPKSTLLLLVAALIGDQWNDVYKFAMSHDFRFLSYGDSCLFLP
jgi:S-adenosylmethionine:tRNA ribosyltransferase-isomerase